MRTPQGVDLEDRRFGCGQRNRQGRWWGGQRWGLSAQAKLNRKDWGLNWNAALETGGWLVGDDIRINAEVQALPEAEYQAAHAEAVMA